jgi:hypothetical protein
MAAGESLSGERVIYRALSKKYLNEALTEPNDLAFLLKPAHGVYEDETYLSFGIHQEAAKKGLKGIKKVCEIVVGDVLALGLKVTEDGDPEKVQVSGMPLVTVDDAQAHLIAKHLREKSRICR